MAALERQPLSATEGERVDAFGPAVRDRWVRGRRPGPARVGAGEDRQLTAVRGGGCEPLAGGSSAGGVGGGEPLAGASSAGGLGEGGAGVDVGEGEGGLGCGGGGDGGDVGG